MQRLTLRNGGTIMIQDRTQENFYTIVDDFLLKISPPRLKANSGAHSWPEKWLELGRTIWINSLVMLLMEPHSLKKT